MKLIKDLGTRLIKGTWVRYAIFKCPECLQEVERDMKAGIKAKSCGCKKNELIRISKTKHGESHSKLHTVWTTMKQRVLNPDATSYKDYGGRGITICPEWTNDYITFRDWALSNGYTDNLQINRINNNGNYEPNNCGWVTRTENNRNQRTTKLSIKIANEIRDLYIMEGWTQKQLAERYNVSITGISHIINNKRWKN